MLRPPRTALGRRGAALLLAALPALAALAGCSGAERPVLAPPLPWEAPRVDILDYDVTLDLQQRARWIEGHVDVTFAALPDRPADELVLDAVEMQIGAVTDDLGQPLVHRYDGRRLSVTLARRLAPGETAIVGIDYSCSPVRGLYFVPPVSSEPGRPWHIWTQGQSQDTRYWVPVWDQLDDRATHSLHVSVDGEFLTMAAGEKTGTITGRRSGRRTDSWRMAQDHPVSLMTLVSGGLAEGALPATSVPLPVVAEAGSMPQVLATLADTPAMLDFLADFAGHPYPYAKYAQCCVKEFTGGGMENISATTLYHEVLHGAAELPQIDSSDLIVHEAAHMWFGDLVGCRDWGHIWLNEGFATYAEALWVQRLRGLDGLRQTMLSFQRQGLLAEDERSRPIAFEGWTDPDEMFDEHSYPAAASRLHLLAEILGPDVFRRGVQLYVDEHAFGIVTTDDLRHSLEAESGSDLSRFFEQWILGAGYPCFELRLLPVGGEPAHAERLLVAQTQGRRGWRPVFRLPVTVAWSRGGVESSRRVLLEAERATVALPGDGPLDWVRFDSTTAVPGRFDLVQSEAMWSSQLRRASDAVTRLIAAQWFAGDAWVCTGREAEWRPAPESVLALCEAARGDPLPAVRATALAALDAGCAPDDGACAALALELASDADALVREAAVRALGTHGDGAAVPRLVAASGDANSTVVAAALEALAAREYAGLFELCRDIAERTSQYQLDEAVVVRVGELLDEPRSLPFLLAAARSEPVPRVRAAALEVLAGRDDPQDVVWRLLAESLQDESFVVRAAAARALGLRHDERSARQLRARLDLEPNSGVRQALAESLR